LLAGQKHLKFMKENGCQNTAYKMGGKNSTLSDIIKILYVGR
jgi:hypothetical protein